MKARLTILRLMGLIAFVGVGMAALRTNDELSAAVVFVLTVFTLCTGVLVAIYRRGAWAGFAVFGWAQFLICQPHSAPTIGPTSPPVGIACRLLISINGGTGWPEPFFGIPGYTVILSDWERDPTLLSVSGGSAGVVGPVPIHSLRAALCLSSILVGFVGALVGGFITRHSVARRDDSGAGAQFRREVVS